MVVRLNAPPRLARMIVIFGRSGFSRWGGILFAQEGLLLCVVINAWPLFRTPLRCVASVSIVPIFRLLLFVVLLILFFLSFVLLFRLSSPLPSFRSCLSPDPLSFLLSFRRFFLTFLRLLVFLLSPAPPPSSTSSSSSSPSSSSSSSSSSSLSSSSSSSGSL